ncbi:MAG: glycosyltransferase [Candidatus Fermentibacteraceae bacterium]|nr:glycosyltransferase [Candidatus Fermentibacteraceae bacterium]
MKTGIVAPFPPYRGGIAQFSMKLLQTLSSCYPEDEFIPLSYRRLYPSLLFPGTSQLEPGTSVMEKGAERLVDSCNPLVWLSTRSSLERRGFNRMIIQWWHPFFAPSLMASIPSSIPSASICHNVIPHESFPMAGKLSRRFLGRMKLAVVHSGTDLEEAESLDLGTRLLQLYHPIYDQYVDPDMTRQKARDQLGYSGKTRLVLFFGLVRSYKGVQDLVRAMGSLPEDILLLIVGECYSDRREIMDIISSLGLSRRIMWIDRFVPDEEVPVYFNAADIVALPYRQATQSGVAQIALSFGKVLVLTDTGGLSELVEPGSTGYLAQPWSPSSVAESILEAFNLLMDPLTGERIHRKAASFSWENYARKLMEALR